MKANPSVFSRSKTAVVAAWLGVVALGALPIHAATFVLGTSNLLEGPATGADSVVLAVTTPPPPGRPRPMPLGCI